MCVLYLKSIKCIRSLGIVVAKENRTFHNIYSAILLRYCRKCSSFSTYNLAPTTQHNDNESSKLLNKIIYNEILIKHENLEKSKQVTCIDNSKDEPIFLKYLKRNVSTEEKYVKDVETELEDEEEVVHFPFDVKKKFTTQSSVDEFALNEFSNSIENFTPSDCEEVPSLGMGSQCSPLRPQDMESPKKWIPKEDENTDEEYQYGLYDPNIPVSSVPCGGCGALLHCSNPSIPGFLPKEVFVGLSKKDLLGEICQRCLFLKKYDVALGVNVSSEEYPKILGKIKDKKALIILMVDLIDSPCSIWPGILKIVGLNKPVIVVGNKIDLILQESPLFLNHLKSCLRSSLEELGIKKENILDISLISAKTGYGVEDFINILFKKWAFKGDVYLIGCTNAGKSTLFNTLIQSDYCKVQAAEIMQRATVSIWPGTTLNLLKFPIMRQSHWRVHIRQERLNLQNKEKEAFKHLQNITLKPRLEQLPLQDHVGRSFQLANPQKNQSNELFPAGEPDLQKKLGLNPSKPEFVNSRWCYDTPGVIHHNQIINILTTAELNLTIPKEMLIPRNFLLKEGSSLFIGGIGRLDFVKGPKSAWFTVYASKELPITITKIKDADIVYQELLGSELFRVPSGGEERLQKWPKMSSKKFEIYGRIEKEAAADVVLSSAGWVSILLPVAYRTNVEAWTPGGRGLYLRTPYIKKGHTFKGKRIGKTPAFETSVNVIKNNNLLENPIEEQ